MKRRKDIRKRKGENISLKNDSNKLLQVALTYEIERRIESG